MKYYLNHDIFETKSKNIFLTNLYTCDYGKGSFYNSLDECVDFALDYLYVINKEDDNLIKSYLNDYQYILESLQQNNLLKYVSRVKPNFFVYTPFISIFEILRLFPKSMYQNKDIYVYDDYLIFDQMYRSIDTLTFIHDLAPPIQTFLSQAKENHKLTYNLLVPMGLKGNYYDIYYCNYLYFDIDEFILEYYPDLVNEWDNYYLKKNIIFWLNNHKYSGYTYSYKSGHAILLNINLNYYKKNNKKILITTISILDNEGHIEDNKDIYYLINQQLDYLYNHYLSSDVVIKFVRSDGIYTQTPIGYYTDYLHDFNNNVFEGGYCDALVSLIVYLFILNHKNYTLLKISEDIHTLCKIKSQKNINLNLLKNLYPQFNVNNLPQLFINTFTINLYVKYYYLETKMIYIPLTSSLDDDWVCDNKYFKLIYQDMLLKSNPKTHKKKHKNIYVNGKLKKNLVKIVKWTKKTKKYNQGYLKIIGLVKENLKKTINDFN